jgi:hypothetical protein
MEIEKVLGVSRQQYERFRRRALECAGTVAERKFVENWFAVLEMAAEVAEEDPRVRRILEEAQARLRPSPDQGGPDDV